MALGELFVSVRASANEFASDMKAIERDAKALEKSLKPIKEQAAAIGTALAATGIAVTGALFAMAKSTADYSDNMRDASIQTGTGIENLSKLAFAAEMSGSSFDGLTTGLKLLSRNMAEAIFGSKEQVRAFQAVGISTQDLIAANGDVNAIFLKIADRFKDSADGAGKTAVAMSLLGRSGADLIPTLNEGSSGLAKLGVSAENAGRVVSEKAGVAADEFNDSLKELTDSVKGVGGEIGNVLIPPMTEFFKKATEGVIEIRKWTAANAELAKAVGVVAIAITGASGLFAGLALIVTIYPKVVVGFGAIAIAVKAAGAAIAALGPGAIAVGLAALSALTYKLAEATGLIDALALKMGQWTGASKVVDKANRELEVSTNRLANKLFDYGVIVERGNKTVEEWNAAVIKAARANANFQSVTEKAKVAIDEEQLSLGKSTKEIDKNRGAREKLVDFWRDALADFKNRTFEGGAEVAAGLAAAEATARTIIELDKERMKLEQRLGDELIKNQQFWDKQLQEFRNDSFGGGGEVAAGLEAADRSAKAIIQNAKDIQRAYADTFRSVKETASRAFLDIFKDGEFQFGKLAGVIKGIFRTLATEILSTMTATLITPLVQRMSKALSGLLGKIPGLGGVFAGAGAGGTAAGGTGGAAGGAGLAGLSATTIAATAGIAAAFLGAVGLVKSQAHHEANTFVKDFQNPFHAMLGNVVDTFDAASAAGKLTKEQAEESLGAVETLWKTFTEQAKEFATHGKDEALVVKQAFETLTPIMDRIRTGMQATTDALRPIIPANSGPVTVNLQMDKRTVARLIIPDLYALTRNEGMVLIGAK